MDVVEVRIGQVWEDNDKRAAGRRVEIVRIDGEFAFARNLGTKKVTRIRLNRFRPTHNGYRFVSETADV